MCTVKYSQLVGIKKLSENIPLNFELLQNYPNPFNSNSKIRFQITKPADVKLTVYDVLGRLITTIVNQKLLSGTYEVDFNGLDYPSGVYLYQLVSDKFIQSKCMILIK
jgi:hypothetical protein